MPFTESEIAEHADLIEKLFWSRRRPPLHLREKIREGQRLDGLHIELFFARPSFFRPGEIIEEDIARIKTVKEAISNAADLIPGSDKEQAATGPIPDNQSRKQAQTLMGKSRS